MVKHCCRDMNNKVLDLNNGDEDLKKDENRVILFSSAFREYGIPVMDGKVYSSSYILIEYCPWCGKRLPESKRYEWFEVLEKLGYDSPFEQDIPEKFKTSEWYETD